MKADNIPEFKSLEEEKRYWEERAQAPGRWTKSKPQKRSSFLAVRLTGEEITRVRDAAAKQGMSPSTFVRQVLISAMEGKKTIALPQAIELLAAGITEADRKRLEELYDSVACPSLESPVLFWNDKNMISETTSILMRAFYAPHGVTVETGGGKPVEQRTKDALPGISVALAPK